MTCSRSELFGYEQGAFTGAVKAKPGKFEMCNNGTIFLDEIGEMAPPLQAKLLQVLQDGTFSRLGSRNTVKVDVRVIAATNVNIKAAIAQKTFREDLYYRINGFSVCIPPLRERRVEIPILTNYFMRRISVKFERKSVAHLLSINAGIVRLFLAWKSTGARRTRSSDTWFWPMNKPSSKNSISAEGATQFVLQRTGEANRGGLKRLVRGLKDDAESAVIAQTLEGTGWNRKAAAIDLKISYKALLYKIKQYNLNQPKRA